MTSLLNDAATRGYFQENDFFGLNPKDVFFFAQSLLPCMEASSFKLILESKAKIADSPDGNGGVYRSLETSGALADMERRGVKYIHAFAIDNALVQPADPYFLGLCISKGVPAGNKSVAK